VLQDLSKDGHCQESTAKEVLNWSLKNKCYFGCGIK
jgi:hypothetical protein